VTAQSLVARIDAIHGAPSTVDSFTTFATCRDCGGCFTVDRVVNARQKRQAHLICSACGEPAVLTVTLARPVTAERAHTDGPLLPWCPLARHLPANAGDAADHLGITRDRLRQHRDNGVTAELADHYAVAVGLHPSQVWGAAWWTATEICDQAVA
jgi:hypothetical protein